MAHFVCTGVKRKTHPAAVEIGGFYADPGVYQHLSRFDIGRFYGNTVICDPDTGEHFATNFPGVMATAPGIGQFSAGQRFADGIDEISVHVRHCAQRGWQTQHLAWE